MYINDNGYSVKSIVTLNGGNKKGFYLFNDWSNCC